MIRFEKSNFLTLCERSKFFTSNRMIPNKTYYYIYQRYFCHPIYNYCVYGLEKNNVIAFDSGYKKAQTAVLDANITTLIAATILFFFGSGPVKGFAVTLGIGIVSTLFSVYYFARHLTSFYVFKNKEKIISI